MSTPISIITIKTFIYTVLAVVLASFGVVAQSNAQSTMITKTLSASANGLVDNAEVKLFGNEQQAFDIFGGSVAVSQGRTIVGSRWADAQRSAFSSASNAGAAYIFSQDINGRYREDARLQPQDIAAGDEFGSAVAISGTIAVVGAYGHDGDFGRLKLEDSGAVYVYNLRSNGNWSLQAKLEPTDASAGLGFGRSVAIEDKTLVIGAAGAGRNNTGAAYVYEFDMGEWIEGQQIVPPTAQQGDEIGSAVAISGNSILISGAGASGSGAAYVYRRHNGRNSRGWQVEAALSAGDNKPQTFFGYSVALDGDIALVGALGDDGAAMDAGASYVFERQSNGDWKAAGKLTATDASRDDKFGGAVALENGLAVVAAEQNDGVATDSGAVYFFSRQSEGNWQLLDKVVAVDANRADHFGSALALENGKLVVGALRDDDLAENSGSTYVYDISSLISSQIVNSRISVSERSASNIEVSENAAPTLAPTLTIANLDSSSSDVSSQDSSSRDYEEIRLNNFGNFQNNNQQAQQGQFGQGQYFESQLNQGFGSNNRVSRNLGSNQNQGFNNQGFNNQGFGNQGLSNTQGFGNQGLSNTQGLNRGQNLNQSNQGFNSALNNNFGSGLNRNLDSGQNSNQGLNQGFGRGSDLNSGLSNSNNTPLFAAPSDSSGINSNNNNFNNSGNSFNNNQTSTEGEGFLGLGRFFRNPNRPRVEDDGTPRLSDITEQPNQQNQGSGFLGLGKLRNLGMGNRSNQSQSTTNLNRDTRFGNQGFNNQGFGNQGFANQGFNNQGFGNQPNNSRNTNVSTSNIMNLRDQVSRVGDYVELELPLFTTQVTYLSSGLPQGLQLDSQQGIIFGEIARNAVGDYDVLIQVDDGQNQLTEGFSWRVNR